MGNLLSRFIGGGLLMCIAAYLVKVGDDTNSLSVYLLSMVCSMVSIALLWHAWREL